MKSRSSSSEGGPEGLLCPACALAHGPEDRFCTRCRMPLVLAGNPGEEIPRDEAHERARKIRPEYTRGRLVRVAGGRNQAEAELIQNLLIEEGVPSILRRSAGFDVPDFLAAGPRDVLVAESGAEAARGILLAADLAPTVAGERSPPGRRAAALLTAVLAGGALATLAALALAGRFG